MLTLLNILGSLGVFLYGMKILSEGIQKVAGQRMRHVMATMTKNRLSGVGTGFGITCLLQSSSATTVIVVSFVNAGLLTLFESIGVVMGANLGTTVTAWIIAAVGKFSLSKVAIPIIGLGLPLFFIGKNRIKNFGEAAIGFGLLFFGLGLLKEAVPDVKGMLASDDVDIVAQAEQFLGMIKGLSGHGYASYLIFLVLGVLLTLVVQSSSAAMAITVTLAINGWIGFEESAFVVLGENIGTTVTAWLAALGANHHAKRAARAHFMFNILGVLWMLAAFPLFAQLVEWLSLHLPESLRTEKHTSDIGFKLAVFHTSFNFVNICLLIGFVPLIARVVTRWVKEPPSEPERYRLKYFTQNLVHTGELNLPEAEKATVELARLTQQMFDGFVEVFNNPHEDLSERVLELRAMEDEADEMTEEITEYLVRCSAAEIGQQNATEVSQMIRIVAELETITDVIYRLVKFAQRRYRKERTFSAEAVEGVREFAELVGRFIALYNEQMFQTVSIGALRDAEALEDRIDARRKQLNRQSMERMGQPEPDLKTEILNMEINNHLEKIGNFALNVMQALHQLAGAEEHPERIAAEVDKMTGAKQPPSDRA
ncbi:MAG: Na/Pi cotransporter family protein [Akkermansiaceae bacterium]|nr:Na/Pi cotransporter family protein [Akkermansiaceae bacterium]NNM28227.1 Na/Pi cotransporter family protein [Akkermansiaceae bacterium]